MIPAVLRRRSSLPSSFVTGLIGWNGLSLGVGLAFGYDGSLWGVLGRASALAIVHVAILRAAFRPLALDRGVWRGAGWGALVGGVLILAAHLIDPLVRDGILVVAPTAIYIGAPVGAFLSYFHRDDRRIEAEASASGKPVEYGRDAHWLDPFVYGAVCHALTFIGRDASVILAATIIGSFVGVVAAGVSHFFLSRFDNAAWTVLPATLGGAVLGVGTGFLFRNAGGSTLFHPLVAGMVGGALTFLATAAVGVFLAKKERLAEGGR